MSNSVINDVKARWVLDSRGNPTVEADITLKDGSFGRAAVPSGASTGIHEALELRDGNKEFGGKHVLKAITNVREKIAPKIIGMDATAQMELDKKLLELDGTPNKSNLGANAFLAVSWATAKAAANSKNVPLYQHIAEIANRPIDKYILPLPMCNVINGGKHGTGIDEESITVQEFMLQPVGAKTFSEGIRWVAEIYQTLKKLMKKEFGKHTTLVGDEGGFSGIKGEVRDALNVLVKATEETGYSLGSEIGFATDPASSEFYDLEGHKDRYLIDGKYLTSSELIDFYMTLMDEYPINSIEDGFAEDDWEGWIAFTAKVGDKILIIGDDLLVTNTTRIQEAIEKKACNALLLKCNQIGSLTEAIEAFQVMFKEGYPTVVSHRSGETEDTTISDIVVGLSTGQIKTGSVARTDRVAKYNQLLRIEELVGSKGVYAGKEFKTIFK
ncbi:MAG: phosphopyruvate hydratase [Promethearchaeota archaeon]